MVGTGGLLPWCEKMIAAGIGIFDLILDFLVTYVAHADLCYAFPVALLTQSRRTFYLGHPDYDEYREAWAFFANAACA